MKINKKTKEAIKRLEICYKYVQIEQIERKPEMQDCFYKLTGNKYYQREDEGAQMTFSGEKKDVDLLKEFIDEVIYGDSDNNETNNDEN